ncbi:MAG: hypothetical protein ACI9OO_001136 [Bacteroidia bacterium]|jgi:hypothetical protein
MEHHFMPQKIILTCLLFCISSAFADASQDRFQLSLKSVLGDAEYVGNGDAAIGTGISLGYRSNGVLVESDYSQLTNFDLLKGFPIATVFGQTFVVPPADDYDIYSHNVFVGYRAGSWAYAEFKVGHSYQRIKESDGARRVLDEINRPAAGVEVGFGSSTVGVGLQHLWLGKDYKQFALALKIYF